MNDQQAIEFHKQGPGKIEIHPTAPLTAENLKLAYTPGVGAVSTLIHEQPESVWQVTRKGNLIAVVSDGTAVLGLGDIGPEAALPVMEGKAVLFKEFANVDAVPICINTTDTEEIIRTVKALEPTFGGINLEDISAPRCFEIEERLKEEMNIPVFHDDQHGTAIVVLAGLINALKLTGRTFEASRFVISGAGAAGSAIARILLSQGAKDIVVLDSKGALHQGREGMNAAKETLASETNPNGLQGSLEDVIKGADVFIGVSAPNIMSEAMVESMAKEAIVFALSNPVPEIMPDKAKNAGAAVVATGRSDFPNQVNNVLAFPGIFRAALDARATDITPQMNLAAARALAAHIDPTPEKILPDVFDKTVVPAVAEAVKQSI